MTFEDTRGFAQWVCRGAPSSSHSSATITYDFPCRHGLLEISSKSRNVQRFSIASVFGKEPRLGSSEPVIRRLHQEQYIALFVNSYMSSSGPHNTL